ncbi:MAG: hypothetical protein R2844_17500 [Caldilineales bacterium]
MNAKHNRTQPSGRPARRRLLLWTVGIVLGLALLSAMPGAWALPSQSPDFQTVPLWTATPTSPGATNTPPPDDPTNTPIPGQPTDTPAPPQSTNTPAPGSTPSATANTTTTTTTTATATRPPVAATAVVPATCLTVPTPGFSPQSVEGVGFAVESDQFLVVPGQQVRLRYIVTNQGDTDLTDLLVCAPLETILGRGQVSASDGTARLVADGLLFELAELGAGDSATAEVQLTIPANASLGSVIENQAWLFADGIQASTDLLTWALPPAYLPPTGHQALSCGE